MPPALGGYDKLTDLIVSFDAADALGTSARFTSSTELLLKGVVKDRSNALYSTVVVSIRDDAMQRWPR